MKSVFGFRVRLGNPDLDFENLNPDFPIERTLYSHANTPLGQSERAYYLITDSPPVPPSVERGQTRVSCEQSACCRNKQKISQLIKQAVPEIHEEGDEVRFGSFNR